MKKFLKIFLKILAILFGILIIFAAWIYFFVLQFSNIKENPVIGKWYRISHESMISSDWSSYRAFVKKWSENKVMVYFAGGGVSISPETAKEDMYNKSVFFIDTLAIMMMNGWIGKEYEMNPFKDWTVIAFPYSTGDFHVGTADLKYIDKNGQEKILHHHGYTNFRQVMNILKDLKIVENPDSVVVTGYSAGAAGASFLAYDIFEKDFPNAKSKTLLVDGMLLFHKDWQKIARDVWKSPEEISNRLKTDNFILDNLVALREKFWNSVNILFTSSTRDGDLAKVQNFFDNGKLEVDEEKADYFQELLKKSVPELQEKTGASVYIWDGLSWYGDPRNLTMHTIIALPYVFVKLNDNPVSIWDWLYNATNGKLENYWIDLLDKKYEKTEK